MSKRKDRERAEGFVYRDGQRIPRHQLDRQQRIEQELQAEQELKRMGLVLGRSRILTPDEVLKERRPLPGKSLKLPPG